MPGYAVKLNTVTVGSTDYHVRSLLDLQQFSDADGAAERAGISSATWPLFGQIWPSAQILAALMDVYELQGKRILEIGAGLALASLVLQRRNGDITVSDCHPLSPVFLRDNAHLNGLQPLRYETGNWAGNNPHLERFDVVIGSDVLYERDHPAQLATFIDLHATQTAEVIIVDPDRGNRAGFCRAMDSLGYACSEHRAVSPSRLQPPYKGRVMNFRRPTIMS